MIDAREEVSIPRPTACHLLQYVLLNSFRLKGRQHNDRYQALRYWNCSETAHYNQARSYPQRYNRERSLQETVRLIPKLDHLQKRGDALLTKSSSEHKWTAFLVLGSPFRIHIPISVR